MEHENELKILTGQVIDGTGAEAVSEGAVVVCGDRIAWCGPATDMPEEYSKAESQKLGGKGYTIMPGLIDGHLHISFGESRTEEENAIYTPVEYRTLKAAWFAKKMLRSGVTSAFDAASTFNIAVSIRNGIEANIVEGPRLAVCGRQITNRQGLEDAFPSWMAWPPGQAGVLVKSRDEIVEAVRVQIKDGVDCIKVSGSSDAAVSSEPIDGSAFTEEEFRLVADEAHRLQRRCAVHARTQESTLLAARAGFDYIMHASFIDDEGIEACLKNNVTIVPTLTPFLNVKETSAGDSVGASGTDIFLQEYNAAGENLSRAYKAGVPMVTGSESGWSWVPYGEWPGRELQVFVEHLGMTPLQAIASATSVAARMLPKWEADIGVLAPGKLADILLINGDPLADINVIQKPSAREAVMKGGKLVDITTPMPTRQIMPFERVKTYLAGWYRYDESTGKGYIES